MMAGPQPWRTAASARIQDAGHRVKWSAKSAPAEAHEWWRRSSSTPQKSRPLVWLYRSTLQKSGLFMRGEQLSTMVRRHAGDRLDVSYLDESTIGSVKDSVIFTTRSFLADANADELNAIRRRNNVICVDYLDWPARPELHQVVDVYIASSIKQMEFYRSKYPKKKVHHITHHADPEIRGVRGPASFCNIGYFGEVANAKHRMELQGFVGFVQTNNSEYGRRDWLHMLPHYNVHYSVRDWTFPTRGPKPGAFKPFTKGFNAARCRANMIVPAGESDAEYYLGSDYPYLLRDDSLESVRSMVELVKDSFRGPDWFNGLEIMAELRRTSSPAKIVQEVETLVRDCE